MDSEIEIGEEDPLSDGTSLKNERDFFTKDISLKTNSNVGLLDDNCDTTIKMEIKSETSFLDYNSQNEREFLQEDPVRKLKIQNSNPEMYNKAEIKDEYWWLKTEASSACGEIEDEDFSPITCPSSCLEAVYGNSGKQSTSAEDLREGGSLNVRQDNCAQEHSVSSEDQESYVTENYSEERNIQSEQSVNSNSCGKTDSEDPYLKQKNVNHRAQKSHKCEICEKEFNKLSNLKRHISSHEGKKPHKCTICDKRFTQLSSLKNHNLIHEGKKPHKCETCGKRFTELSNLKSHNLIHEGKRPYKCAICEMRFTQLSGLKRHNLIHEGKKPHICEICQKRFTQLWNLKAHSLIHKPKKPQV